MPLVSFPSDIDVTLGSKWTPPGRYGLDANDIVTIKKLSGSDDWSEDGTNTGNQTTNRMKVRFGSSPAANLYAYANVYLPTTATSAWHKSFFFTDTFAVGHSNYTFKYLWSNHTTTGNIGTQSLAFYTTESPFNYNSDIFSSMEEAGSGPGEANIQGSGILSGAARVLSIIGGSIIGSGTLSAAGSSIVQSDGASVIGSGFLSGAAPLVVAKIGGNIVGSGHLAMDGHQVITHLRPSMNLFLQGPVATGLTSSMDMFVESVASGVTDAQNGMNMFIEGEPFSTNMNLYLAGPSGGNPFASDMNLIMFGQAPASSGSLDLFLYNDTGATQESIDLFIQGLGTQPGSVPHSGDMNLYLENQGITSSLPLFIEALEGSLTGEVELYTFGASGLDGNLTMYMPAFDTKLSGPNRLLLFTRGFND